MIHGFVRLKPRTDRRAGYPIQNRWQHFKMRFMDVCKELKGWFKLTLELEEAWLATRSRRPLEEKVISELVRLTQYAKEWRDLRINELYGLYKRAAEALEKKEVSRVRVPSRFQLWLAKCNIFYDHLTFTRMPMRYFWSKVRTSLKEGKIFKINYIRVVATMLEEAVLFFRFLFSLLKSETFLQ